MDMDYGQFDQSLRKLFSDYSGNPLDIAATVALCHGLNIRAHHGLCIEYARRGLSHAPYNPDLYHELIIASSLDAAHILETILEELESLLEHRPHDRGIRRNIALVHYYLEDDHLAERILLDLRDEDAGVELDAQAFETLAQVEYTRFNFEECLEICEKALALHGPNARLNRLQGLCMQEQLEPDRANAFFHKALEVEPYFIWACHSLAELEFEQKNFDQAFRFFGMATFINPHDPGNLFLLSEAFMDMEAFDLALAELTKLLMLRPPKRIEAEVHNAMGYVLMKMDRNQEARKHLSLAIELEPELAVAYFNMGQLAQKDNQLQLAERHFKNAIGIDPQFEEAWLELGFVHIQQEKFEQAERCFHKVQELDPEDAQVFLGLSKLHQAAHAYKAQLAAARHAFDLDPENPEINNNLGIALECNQDLVEAEQAYMRTLDLDPYHAPAANNLGYLYEKKMDLHPEDRDEYKHKAIAAWKARLSICISKNASTKAATSHLLKLGLGLDEVDSMAKIVGPFGE